MLIKNFSDLKKYQLTNKNCKLEELHYFISNCLKNIQTQKPIRITYSKYIDTSITASGKPFKDIGYSTSMKLDSILLNDNDNSEIEFYGKNTSTNEIIKLKFNLHTFESVSPQKYYFDYWDMEEKERFNNNMLSQGRILLI